MDNDKEPGNEQPISLQLPKASCKCWYDCRHVLDGSNRMEASLKEFYMLGRDQQMNYLMDLIEIMPIKKKYTDPSFSRRKMSVLYLTPQVGDSRYRRVCKTTFMQIFAMTDRKMETLIRKKKEQRMSSKGKSPINVPRRIEAKFHNTLDDITQQPIIMNQGAAAGGMGDPSPLPFLFVSANEAPAASGHEPAMPIASLFEGSVYVEQTMTKQQVVARMQAISQQVVSLEGRRREKEAEIAGLVNPRMRQRSQHLLDKLLYELASKHEEYEDLTQMLLQYD